MFKKVLSLIMLFLASIGLAACGEQKTPVTPDDKPNVPDTPEIELGYDDSTKDEPKSKENVGFVIHFNVSSKVDDKFRYNLWLWEDGKDGGDYQFNGIDAYGAYSKQKFSDFSVGLPSSKLGFIVKENKPWADGPSKDWDGDRFMEFSKLEKDESGYYHIWLMTQDEKIYINHTLKELDDIIAARFGSRIHKGKEELFVWFQTNKEFSDFKITKNGETLVSNETAKSDEHVSKYQKTKLVYELSEFPDLTASYQLEVKFKDSGSVYTREMGKENLFKTKDFGDRYNYDGDLGAIYTKEATTFRVWSPIAKTIKVRIYDNGTPTSVDATRGNDTHEDYPLIQKNKGVWENTINGDLHGKYYTYVVTNAKYKDMEVVDPYAKSAGINGLRGMVVDFSKTNPEGWDAINAHQIKRNNLAVYETHIADLTSSKTWNGTPENAKRYTGFYEAGTTYTEGNTTVKTGFDHIKELGVNAVQILPFFDSYNDEVNPKFNWGYNPLNYNVLDGSYSNNPYDGLERIKEFKNLVKAYNEAGINIIMDVVYNHVNGLDKSNFDVLMPGYYFRYSNGVPKNGSGCGNETASNMYMFRKFMIDSTEFWASEYKLGGFRFDLMGIHDVNTMNQLTANLKKVNESIVVYGEPWAAGSISMEGEEPAMQAAMNKYEGYGCFNDKIRDGLIRGGLSSASEKGWIANDASVDGTDLLNIKNGITGLIIPGNSVHEASKAVTYVTCHDNYTLYDRFKAAGITDEVTLAKMNVLANSVVFTSQGLSFMLAGEEFLRTKNGNSNSYDAPYDLNSLDYSLKIKHMDMFKTYQKLIELKTTSNLFNKSDAEAKLIDVKNNGEGSLIQYKLTDGNKEYLIIHSNGVASADKTVNLSGYTLYLDTLNTKNLVLGSTTQLNPYQTIIAYKNI